MTAIVGAGQIEDLLARRHNNHEEWAFFSQVRSRTGAGPVRTADAIAMNLWPSRGLAIHGYEIKVARNDWLRELKDPGKAEAVAKHCDYWWVAAPKGLVDPAELPLGWGLLACTAKQARVQVQAKQQATPDPIDRRFVASVLRSSQGALVAARSRDDQELNKRIADKIEAARECGAQVQAVEVSRLQKKLEQVAEFESEAGVQVFGWGLPERARSFKEYTAAVAIDPELKAIRRSLTQTMEQCRSLLERMDRENES